MSDIKKNDMHAPEPTMNDLSYNELLSSEGTVFHLKGMTMYRTWEVIGGKVWQNTGNPCVALLEFLDRKNFRVTFTETKSAESVTIICYGKIGSSRKLSFKYPVPLMTLPDGTGVNITDIIRQHACAKICGPCIDEGTLYFKGKFDGTRFTATAKFMAMVESPCPSNDMFDPSMVRGNLNWTFSYDLTLKND